MRVKLNPDGDFVQEKKDENSIFIYYEHTDAILEYAPNKMIVSLTPNVYLFIDNWAATRHLKQPQANDYQFDLKVHPLFHDTDFPFVVSSGKSYFSWINVKENKVQMFID